MSFRLTNWIDNAVVLKITLHNMPAVACSAGRRTKTMLVADTRIMSYHQWQWLERERRNNGCEWLLKNRRHVQILRKIIKYGY